MPVVVSSSTGRLQQAGDLKAALQQSRDLVATLDGASLDAVMALLPASLSEAVSGIAERIAKEGPGRLLMDSDGTALLAVKTGDAALDQECYRQLAAEGRVFPGGGVNGEVAQQYIYGYRVPEAQIVAWERLAANGLQVGVLSGRKEDQLAAIYQAALERVPGFMLLPSKGRVQLTEEGAKLLPELERRLQGNPIKDVALEMGRIIAEQIDHGHAAEVGALDALRASSGGDFERLTGYRVSIQEAVGQVVMIRLHHRFRACQLASQAGCQVDNIDQPLKVDSKKLSEWLASPAGAEVLARLQREDAQIAEAWKGRMAELGISIKDYVGYRSLSQDMAPELSYQTVLRDLAPVYLYAGDHWEASGNDRPIMDALRAEDPSAVLIGVGDHARTREPGMATGDQFELFLFSYALGRALDGAAESLRGPQSAALEYPAGSQAAQASVRTFIEQQLAPIPPETIAALAAAQPSGAGSVDVAGQTIPEPELFDQGFLELANGSHLDQRGFLVCYAALYNRAVGRALELMAEHHDLQQLRGYRDGLAVTGIAAEEAVSAPCDLETLNTYLKRRVVELSQAGAGDPRVEEVSADLAVMTLDYAARREQTIQALEAIKPQVCSHAQIISAAREGAAHDPSAEAAFARMFMAALDQKAAALGYRPPLITFHDIDYNLGAHDGYNRQKPSDGLDLLLDGVLHPLVPAMQIGPRVPLIHLLRESREGGAAAPLYHECGRLIDEVLFADARSAPRRAAAAGIDFRILTTNLAACAEGVVDVLESGAAPIPIQAVSLNSIDGLDKPLMLAEALAHNPDALLVMVDDSNSALCRALARGQILPGLDFPLPLQDVAFFAARVPGDGEEQIGSFKLQQTLGELGLPFAENHQQLAGAVAYGYQGFHQIVDLYEQWCRAGGSKYPLKAE